MDKQTYVVTLGIEHPRTGHWLAAGSDIELTDSEATMLLATGHVIKKADVAAAKKGK